MVLHLASLLVVVSGLVVDVVVVFAVVVRAYYVRAISIGAGPVFDICADSILIPAILIPDIIVRTIPISVGFVGKSAVRTIVVDVADLTASSLCMTTPCEHTLGMLMRGTHTFVIKAWIMVPLMLLICLRTSSSFKHSLMHALLVEEVSPDSVVVLRPQSVAALLVL